MIPLSFGAAVFNGFTQDDSAVISRYTALVVPYNDSAAISHYTALVVPYDDSAVINPLLL